MENTPVLIGETFSLFVKACETQCEAACCGLHAFDFGPINIAKWLTEHWDGRVASLDDQLSRLDPDLSTLERKYGEVGAVRPGILSEDLNDTLTGAEVTSLVAEIRANAQVALEMVALAEGRRVARTSSSRAAPRG
jgi:hypothetical protein